MPSNVKSYAKVTWCALDIGDLCPGWSVTKSNDFLDENEDYIQTAMIEAGWSAISSLVNPILAAEEDDVPPV